MLSLPTYYLCASAVALKVAALSYERDRRHAVQIAGALALSCAIYNATWITHAWWFWPPMDAAVACFVAIRCRAAFRPWKAAIVSLSAAQVAAHVRYQIGDKFGGSAYAYHLTLNILFLAQLVAVSSSGSGRVRRSIRDFVVDRCNRGSGRCVGALSRRAATPPGE